MPRSTALDAIAIAPGSLVVSVVVGITLAAGGFVIGIGATGLAAGTTSFWYLSRATGFVAYLLLWGSVTWGLLLSTGTGRAWMRPPQLLDAHQFLSTAGAGFACFHSLVLMGDRYVSFPLRAVILPFGGSYEPLLVAFGQIAAWLSLLLIASFHVRRHIGGRSWRRLHYASRRSKGEPAALLRVGAVALDSAGRTVALDGQTIDLQPREFALLQELMLNAGRVLSRDQLEERMYRWGEEVGSNAVEVHVHHLRRKLGADIVKTIRGVGYVMPRGEHA
jgi:hypothetical protein